MNSPFASVLCHIALLAVLPLYAQVDNTPSVRKPVTAEPASMSPPVANALRTEAPGLDEPFGYHLLAKKKTSESPISAVQDDYLLKQKDEIVIDVWGDINLHYKLMIVSEGYIDIPRAGRVFLKGLSLKDGRNKIRRAMAQAYSLFIDAEKPGTGTSLIDITLGKEQGISVFVAGEVATPGEVNVPATSASVLRALTSAGGIDKTGSFRRIRLTKRVNGKETLIDLYDFLLSGHVDAQFKYLDDGDVLFVPYCARKISIDGAVQQPGAYELLPDEGLPDLVRFCGGFAPDAVSVVQKREGSGGVEMFSAAITRNEGGEFNVTLPQNLLNGDRLQIIRSRVLHNLGIVRTGGALANASILELLPDMTLEQAIIQSGGFLDSADQSALELLRLSGRTLTARNIDFRDASSKAVKLQDGDIIQVRSMPNMSDFGLASIRGAVERPGEYHVRNDERLLSLIERAGSLKEDVDDDYVLVWTRDKTSTTIRLGQLRGDAAEKRYNFTVQADDSVFIRAIEPWVYVEGAVQKPGRFIHVTGKDSDYYITLAGGMTDKADGEVQVITIDREIQTRKLFGGRPAVSMESTIMVK